MGFTTDVCFVELLIVSKFVDEFAEPVRIIPPTHSVYVNKPESDRSTTPTVKPTLIALGHVWRADQSVVVTTNKDVLLLYSPLKNTCRVLSVSPMSKKSKRKITKEEDGGEVSESDEEDELSGDESEEDVHGLDEVEAVVPVECMIYSKDLLIAGGRVCFLLWLMVGFAYFDNSNGY
jgi:hypothetical protein